MDALKQAREEINLVDEQLAELYQRRMQAVQQVLAYKQLHGLPVLDQSRELAVIQAGVQRVPDALKPYYADFLKDLMANSRRFQQDKMAPTRVAYQGVEGAFSHIASQKLYETSQKIQYPSFLEVFEAVQNGSVDVGVIPFENSYTGEVGDVLDLLYQFDVNILQMFDLQIEQNLLGVPGSQISQIKEVYSHPQALGQCALYLKDRDMTQIPYPNTAMAAKYVCDQADKTKAAIASSETAKLYGLQILAKQINTSAENTTRFIVIGKQPGQGGGRFSLLFAVNHQSGALAKAIETVGEFGFNMESIRSRSMKQLPWQHYFYAQMSGNVHSQQAVQMLAQLQTVCKSLKVVGSFDLKK